MAKLTYNVPSEFSDEDKWLKYFSKRDLGILIATGFLTVILYKITGYLFRNPLIGAIIGLLIMAVCVGISMIKLPDTLYLSGGGQSILIVLLKRLIRKKNKIIYVRGYDEEDN